MREKHLHTCARAYAFNNHITKKQYNITILFSYLFRSNQRTLLVLLLFSFLNYTQAYIITNFDTVILVYIVTI